MTSIGPCIPHKVRHWIIVGNLNSLAHSLQNTHSFACSIINISPLVVISLSPTTRYLIAVYIASWLAFRSPQDPSCGQRSKGSTGLIIASLSSTRMSYHHSTRRNPFEKQHRFENLYAQNSIDVSPGLLLTYVICGALIVYNLLQQPLSLPPLWTIFVYPFRRILSQQKQEQIQGLLEGSLDKFKIGGGRVFDGIGVSNVGSMTGNSEGWVGGLYNTGNTCYQNSVLQVCC